MLAAGLWSRTRKRSPHRRRRERKAHFGELVQMDGSFHTWFEQRAPTSCLLTLVDDATGQTLGRFRRPTDDLGGGGSAPRLDRTVRHPQALYTDWKNVYVRPPNQIEWVTGAEPLTQFGRMRATLHPDHHGELAAVQGADRTQSRDAAGSLGEKLRRKGLADIKKTANAFLETEYWADHNERFAQAPTSADDFHVARPRELRLETVFRLEEPPTVSNDWVVQYHKRLLQLERQSGHAPARSTVLVCENAAGTIEIRYRDRVMRWTDITVGAAAPSRSAPVRPAPIAARRQGFKDMGRDVPYWQLVK